jgi:hypothetical protein
VPVKLISSGSQPCARACVTSPGEHASMPIAPGDPGVPMPRRTVRISGKGFAFRAKRNRAGIPETSSAAAKRLAFSAARSRS